MVCDYMTALGDLQHRVTNPQIHQCPSPDHFCRIGLPWRFKVPDFKFLCKTVMKLTENKTYISLKVQCLQFSSNYHIKYKAVRFRKDIFSDYPNQILNTLELSPFFHDIFVFLILFPQTDMRAI